MDAAIIMRWGAVETGTHNADLCSCALTCVCGYAGYDKPCIVIMPRAVRAVRRSRAPQDARAQDARAPEQGEGLPLALWPTTSCCLDCKLMQLRGLPSGASHTKILRLMEALGDEVLASELEACGLSRAEATSGFQDYLVSLVHAPDARERKVRTIYTSLYFCAEP